MKIYKIAHQLILSPGLRNEIQFRVEAVAEMGESESLSLNEALKQTILDAEYSEGPATEFRKELQNIQIQLGIVKPYTLDQLKERYVSRGKKYDFKRGNIYYAFESWLPLENLVLT